MKEQSYPGAKYVAQIQESIAYIRSKTDVSPRVLITLGSGLGDFVDEAEQAVSIPYSDIPNFPLTTVAGHQGRLVIGYIANKPVAIMQGRVHQYEGYSGATVAYPLRTIGLLGADTFIVTNACGGINKNFKPGTLMVLNNHIGLFSDNPSIGVYHPSLGAQFYDVSYPYDEQLRGLAKSEYEHLGIPYAEGVYVQVRGPAYETTAEVGALRVLGADAVGMSTVPEVNAARQLKMRVLGIASVTNMAAGISTILLNHEEVLEAGKLAAKNLRPLLRGIIQKL